MLAGGLWIFFSDLLLRVFVFSPDALTRLQAYKGWFFVIGMAVFLVWLIRRYAEELRRSEVAVRHAGEQLDHVLERIADGVVALNTDWVYTYVNSTAAEMFNRRPADLIGRHIWTEFPEGVGQPFQKAYARAVETQEPVHLDDYYAPWGRWFENRIYPGAKGITIFFTDITERKRTELDLQESERYNRMLFDSSPIGLALCRMDGSLIDVNEAYAKIIGRTVAETLKFSYWDMTPKKYAEQEQAQLRSLETAGRYGPYEKEYIHREGRLVPVRLHGLLIERGGEPCIWSSVEDITERRRQDALLLGQRDVLEMISRDASLGESLTALLRVVEAQSEEMLSSLLLLDEDGIHVRHLAAPRLPADYTRAIDGSAIGPRAGSCGTAAYRGEMVITEDIMTDPLWDEYRAIVEPHGLRACWSTPIMDSHRRVLGTFALYFRTPGRPTEFHQRIIDMVTHVASVAISKQRRDKALTESEARYRGLFESANVGKSITLPSGEISVNKAFAEMLGYSQDELKNKTWQELTPPEEIEEIQNSIAPLLNGEKKSARFEKRYLHKSGAEVWADVSVALQRTDDGAPSYFIATIVDIADRKKAEAALRRNEHLLRLFVEHSPAAIAMLDRDMRYIVASRRFLTDYELGDRNIIGRSHYEVFPEIPERWRDIHRRCLAGAVERAEEDPFPRADGRMDWIRWEIRPWYETEGEIGGVILFSEVITERKHAEKELARHRDHLEDLVQERTAELQDSQRALTNMVTDLNKKTAELEIANDRLKELDRLKSLFIASMSHELRTPLNSVIGFSSILLNEWVGPLNDEQKENLASVLRSGKHLLALINDVIDVSKIEAGVIEIMTAEFDLYDLIEEAVEGLRGEAQNKGLALFVEPVHQAMRTDRRRLLQCVLNLLSNAVKFTEKGEVRLSARRTPEKCGKRGVDCVEIIVQDTGIGITAEDLPKLFTSFTRLESPLKGRVLGTGLGLYLTKKITVEILQGEVDAAGAPGLGSRFALRIPVVREEE